MLKYIDEYRDESLCLDIAARIKAISKKPINIMEVCGGHTMAIRKNGLHKLVGDKIRLLSGPGCPVCVTAMEDIDKAIALSRLDKVIICTFGDLFYVPGTNSSLSEESSYGADVRVVYSVRDALKVAFLEPDKKVIFISIGFETTTPTVAQAILQAREDKINNFYVLALNKTMPHALRAIIQHKDSKIDALICPGHVSTIGGTGMYQFIVDEFKIPCCVSGFEPADMLMSIYILTELLENNQVKLVNAYPRAVVAEGNQKAQAIVQSVFKACDANWRGVGVIPSSGLRLREDYASFDVGNSFNVTIPAAKEKTACACGEILVGAKEPKDCPLFARSCTPLAPQGACMVSSEGACAAWYKYRN